MLWRSTASQLRPFHYSCHNVDDVKITSPALGSVEADYIISRVASKLEFGEIKVNSKIGKVNKL